MLLPPSSHDKRVIDRNASDLLNAFTLQRLSLLHKAREVSLKAAREAKHQLIQKIVACKTQQTRDESVDSYLGATRSKSSRYSEEDSLLPLEELIHSHLISWLALLDFHCGEMFTNLLGGEKTM